MKSTRVSAAATMACSNCRTDHPLIQCRCRCCWFWRTTRWNFATHAQVVPIKRAKWVHTEACTARYCLAFTGVRGCGSSPSVAWFHHCPGSVCVCLQGSLLLWRTTISTVYYAVHPALRVLSSLQQYGIAVLAAHTRMRHTPVWRSLDGNRQALVVQSDSTTTEWLKTEATGRLDDSLTLQWHQWRQAPNSNSGPRQLLSPVAFVWSWRLLVSGCASVALMSVGACSRTDNQSQAASVGVYLFTTDTRGNPHRGLWWRV